MSHKSRIGCIVIDCQTDDLTQACAFWSAALGKEGKIDPDGKYAQFDGHEGYPKVLLQAVDHAPRVHLDIETDDQGAEATRLAALGAERIGAVRSWTVMQAPTGHRFCLVGPQGGGGLAVSAGDQGQERRGARAVSRTDAGWAGAAHLQWKERKTTHAL